MRTVLLLGVALLMASCAPQPQRPPKIEGQIADELNKATEHRARPPSDAGVSEALLPPLKAEMPKLGTQAIEPRFDLSVNNAPAAQVFMSIVSGTRYSMLVHPEVSGSISVNLKDVTVREALEAIRELYGYEFRVDGTRVFIQPVTIHTRVYRVNYLIGQRLGRSDVRVTSGSVADQPLIGGVPGVPGVPGAAGALPTMPGAAPGAAAGAAGVTDSSRIQTQTKSDFWDELTKTLQAIIGTERGRSVVVNPQAGVVVVRALPSEQRQVDAYLKAIRASVERQVMLEAKIIEVTLNEQFQSGINWALFSSSGRSSAAQVAPGTTIGTTGTLSSNNLSLNPQPGGASAVTAATAGTLIQGVPGGALIGLAFQAQNFVALLNFLETQGNVQVLSSPRIATINNQKAVLKVGTDEFFITNVAGGTVPTATAGVTTGTAFPSLTLRPFFSGVALDITPQIDEDSSIILHIHPSVSNVQQDNRRINLGNLFGGDVTLPLARSTVSETDSIVKAVDGNIVAIGGLMKVDVGDDRSGIPGAQDTPVGGLFRSARRTVVKKELVILIKPTVIQGEQDWNEDLRQARERILGGSPGQERR